MPGFYGYRTVVASRNKHRRTGKVTTATLTLNGVSTPTSVSYANAYIWPYAEANSLDGSGRPVTATTIVLWRLGESQAPRVHDTLAADGHDWLVLDVTSRLNADETNNFAVYDCRVARST